MINLVNRLTENHRLSTDEYLRLLESDDRETLDLLRNNAVSVTCQKWRYGIFVRGLIEISSYCRNNCYYCGLRRDNRKVERYRLNDDEILQCCDTGYRLGLRTIVLQSGEDIMLTDKRLVPLIAEIHHHWNDMAITLSLGERSIESYRLLHQAGATRYLLRHEAADARLYNDLHPAEMSYKNRLDCIKNLMKIGYQTGMGFMVGVPGQAMRHLVADLKLLELMRPQMIGIGPFLPHPDTPFALTSPGCLNMTLKLIAIARLICPDALIPATTALSTLSPEGHKLGVLSGSNVIMPNLTPSAVRSKYSIYPDKAASGTESAENLNLLEQELATIGYHIDYSRGDFTTTA